MHVDACKSSRYAPGDREKLESIKGYLRKLPAAQDFKGALATPRRWKLASNLGLPEQAPDEGFANGFLGPRA